MQTKPRTPRQQEQYERILQTTREMLAEDGYEGMQMRLLAERAGVSPMTLYNRFGNKDDLILLALQDLLNGLAEEAQATGLKGIEFQLANTRILARQILDTPEYARAMAQMLFSAAPGAPIIQTLLGNQLESGAAHIQEMLDLGELDSSVDMTLMVRSLAVSGWSTILLWHKSLLSDEAFIEQYQRSALLVLAAAMTPETRLRYADLLKS